MYKAYFFLDGRVKYWIPESLRQKETVECDLIDENSVIVIKESGLYLLYAQVSESL